MNKKGLSPVIATVLLISLAVILALIIFLWARSVVNEKIQKFDEPIENACEGVVFDGEAYMDGVSTTIAVVNRGNVPIYGLEIRKKNLASASVMEATPFETSILNGQTETMSENIDAKSGDKLILVPILLGQEGDLKKAFVCDDRYSLPVEID